MNLSNLTLINDSTLLSRASVYQIDRTLYRFLYETDSIRAPNYVFKPLPGQRKKANLQLNQRALKSRVWEVEGMTTKASVISQEYLQLALPL